MILGFNLQSIEAHVDEQNLTGNLDVNSTPNIEDVVEKKFDFLGENKAVGVKFSFKSSYGKAGDIILKGEVIYKVDDAKKTLRMWKDEGKLNEEMSLTVLNFVLGKCMAKAVDLADTLRLPPPMQFPRVVKGEPHQPKVVEMDKKKR